MWDSDNSELIHEALTAESFELDRSETRFPKYKGTLSINGKAAACEIHVIDVNFLKLPKLKILDPRFRKHSVAHFENSDYYCYANNNENVINKYDPRGAVRSNLDMMKAALEHHISNDLSEEIAREFPQHWLPDSVVYSEFQGANDRSVKVAQVKNEGGRYLLACECTATVSLMGDIAQGHKKAPISDAYLIEYPGNLTFLNGQTQPTTLAEVVVWGNSMQESLGDKALEAFGIHGRECIETVFIKAANATIGMKLDTSALPASLLERKAGINKILVATRDKVKIDRIFCQTVSEELLFQRNLPEGITNLSDRKIALIGCGTIGSHLCKTLAQSGAGKGEGNLVLIDNQNLAIENIGRHFLGPNRIGQNKAVACEQEMKRLFSNCDVTGIDANAIELFDQLEEFDLVIDATGEEALSVLVNEWLRKLQLRGKKIHGLFVMLFGNAEAGQALLVDGEEYACFRCLKPRHGEKWRYEPRNNPEVMEITPANCGEAPYVPYGVGGAVMAAGLACRMVLDWANADPSPRLRTVRINFEATHTMKDVNPKISPACPLCGSTNS